jgi:hypothetical protein
MLIIDDNKRMNFFWFVSDMDELLNNIPEADLPHGLCN